MEARWAWQLDKKVEAGWYSGAEEIELSKPSLTEYEYAFKDCTFTGTEEAREQLLAQPRPRDNAEVLSLRTKVRELEARVQELERDLRFAKTGGKPG